MTTNPQRRILRHQPGDLVWVDQGNGQGTPAYVVDDGPYHPCPPELEVRWELREEGHRVTVRREDVEVGSTSYGARKIEAHRMDRARTALRLARVGLEALAVEAGQRDPHRYYDSETGLTGHGLAQAADRLAEAIDRCLALPTVHDEECPAYDLEQDEDDAANALHYRERAADPEGTIFLAEARS